MLCNVLLTDTDQTLVSAGSEISLKELASVICIQEDMGAVLADGLKDLQGRFHVSNMKHWQFQLDVPCSHNGLPDRLIHAAALSYMQAAVDND